MDTPDRAEHGKRFLLSLGCLVLLALVFSPSYQAFLLWARVPESGFMIEVRRAGSVLEQAQNPGTVITDGLHGAIQWRLLFPALAHVLKLPAPILFGLSHAGCLVLLHFMISVLRRRGAAWGAVATSVLVLGAASWFFTSVGWLGYYDSWLALGLVLVACARRSWVVVFACLWAPWVDERFVLAFPLALACRHWLWGQGLLHGRDEEARPRQWLAEYALPCALVLGFAALRLGILPAYSGAKATVSGYLPTQHNFQAPAGRLLLGVWEGLRGGWVLALAGLLLAARRGRDFWLVAAGALLLILAGLYTAQDFSRSMTMVLPLALAATLVLHARRPAWLDTALGALALVVLLLPAHHVMNDRVDSIYPVHHELYLLDNPPRELMPELYQLEAIRLMELGDNAAAEGKLDIAILLHRHPVSPLQHRGLLRANQGRWAEAQKDFARLVEIDPKDPNCWLLYAQACFALNDSASARTHMQKALSLAPEGWSRRPDVARFLSKLNQR